MSGRRGLIARTTCTTRGALGFVSSGPDAENEGVVFDTSQHGNGNGGHTYGRDLPVEDPESLLEHLKTL